MLAGTTRRAGWSFEEIWRNLPTMAKWVGQIQEQRTRPSKVNQYLICLSQVYLVHGRMTIVDIHYDHTQWTHLPCACVHTGTIINVICTFVQIGNSSQCSTICKQSALMNLINELIITLPLWWCSVTAQSKYVQPGTFLTFGQFYNYF